jgi:hypothetical protein
MSVFDDVERLHSPFEEESKIFDRKFSLYKPKVGRTSDRSPIGDLTLIGTFMGCEPQLVQRVTTNLLSVGEGGDLAMQQAAYQILTDYTDLVISKGYVAIDPVTTKKYQVIAPHRQASKYDLMVTELDD